MSNIFEAGGLGEPKEKRFKMIKKSVKAGQISADLYYSVIGMQKYDGFDTPTRLDFTGFNTVQPLNIAPILPGKIYFLLRITYRLRSTLMKPMPGVVPSAGRISLGKVHYRASFDYMFVRDKTGGADLKIQDADLSSSPDDDEHEGDDDLTVALSDFNARVQGGMVVQT